MAPVRDGLGNLNEWRRCVTTAPAALPGVRGESQLTVVGSQLLGVEATSRFLEHETKTRRGNECLGDGVGGVLERVDRAVVRPVVEL